MDREFNLIDEPWICVRDNGCEVNEISRSLNTHRITRSLQEKQKRRIWLC